MKKTYERLKIDYVFSDVFMLWSSQEEVSDATVRDTFGIRWRI